MYNLLGPRASLPSMRWAFAPRPPGREGQAAPSGPRGPPGPLNRLANDSGRLHSWYLPESDFRGDFLFLPAANRMHMGRGLGKGSMWLLPHAMCMPQGPSHLGLELGAGEYTQPRGPTNHRDAGGAHLSSDFPSASPVVSHLVLAALTSLGRFPQNQILSWGIKG